MKVLIQLTLLCVAVHMGAAHMGTANPVCDPICPNDFPVTVNRHLPIPDDCEHFCHCANDGNWLKECPLRDTNGNRLHFNPILEVCDWPESAGCIGGGGGGGETTTTTKPPPGPKPDGCKDECGADECWDRPNEDCTQFCRCDHGDLTVETCPSGLHFNPTTKTCDLPENAGCEVVTEPPPPVGCPIPCEDGECLDYSHAWDCTMFCRCTHGDLTEEQCPSGLHFNPHLNMCDTPENAGCEEEGGSGGDGECDNICPDEFPVTQNRHLPIPNDCEHFCHCANDGAHKKICPLMANGKRLHFNAKKQVCDWPQDAGCTAAAFFKLFH